MQSKGMGLSVSVFRGLLEVRATAVIALVLVILSVMTGFPSMALAEVIAGQRAVVLPAPAIQINDATGGVVMPPGSEMTISVGLDNADSSVGADWWLVALTPFGCYSYCVATGLWTPYSNLTDLIPLHQSTLFDISPVFDLMRINTSTLPAGVYWFYFGVDTRMNGILDFDCLFYDAVFMNLMEPSYVMTLQAEDAPLKHGGYEIMRSNAEGALVWHLDLGGEIGFNFNGGAPLIDAVAVRYSNDDMGQGDTIGVLVDGMEIGTFQTQDTGNNGDGWNVFAVSPMLVLGRLSGMHTVSFRVYATDGFGVDLDSVAFYSANR